MPLPHNWWSNGYVWFDLEQPTENRVGDTPVALSTRMKVIQQIVTPFAAHISEFKVLHSCKLGNSTTSLGERHVRSWGVWEETGVDTRRAENDDAARLASLDECQQRRRICLRVLKAAPAQPQQSHFRSPPYGGLDALHKAAPQSCGVI